MEERRQKERKLYLEVLRIIAILLVIFNHTDGFFLYYTNTENPLTFFYSLFFSILCRVNVPLFFMISGALLLGREETLAQLFRKRILRIIMVIFLFSAVQYGVDLLRGTVPEASVAYFLRGVVCGTIEESYWFLYAYLGILLLLPFLRAMVKGLDGSRFSYLLLLEILLAVLLPVVGTFIGWNLPSYVYFLNVNVFYMLMGYALDQELIGRKAWDGCFGEKEHRGNNWTVWRLRSDSGMPAHSACSFTWIIFLGGSFCIALSAAICMLRYAMTGTYLQSDLDMFVPLLSLTVFETVRRWCVRIRFPDAAKKGILCLGSCAFGIYLLEQMVRILLLPMYLYLCTHAVGVVECTAYVVGTWLVSLVLTLILKRVPVLGKLL